MVRSVISRQELNERVTHQRARRVVFLITDLDTRVPRADTLPLQLEDVYTAVGTWRRCYCVANDNPEGCASAEWFLGGHNSREIKRDRRSNWLKLMGCAYAIRRRIERANESEKRQDEVCLSLGVRGLLISRLAWIVVVACHNTTPRFAITFAGECGHV